MNIKKQKRCEFKRFPEILLPKNRKIMLLKRIFKKLHKNMNIFIIYTTENILVYTSFIFLTNVITAFYREYYLYAFLFIMLTMTSVIVHTNDNIYTNTIDKFSVFCVVIYGGNMLWNKYLVCHEFEYFIPTFMVVISFSFCIFVYIFFTVY